MKVGKFIFKNVLTLFLATVIATTALPSVTLRADDDVKPTKVKITMKKRTVTAGDEFKLYAKLTPYNADDDDVIWTITKGKNVICFDDDRDGNDAEFRALKAGTAKVRCKIKGTNKKAYATIKVKAAPKAKATIKRVGKKNRTVELGDDFELKVKKSSGVKNKHLKWTIKNSKIVKFDDDDRYDDEVEFKATKIGKTTITCKNTKTNKKIKFTINVVYDYDDDYDDDDDDD